jgi:hypothetical protein
VRKLIVLAVVLGGLAVGDTAVKSWAESKIEARVRVEAGGDSNPEADIKSFPFVGRLLVAGNAGDISLDLRNATAGPLRFSTLSIEMTEVHLDRAKMLSRKVELTSIDKGVVTMGFKASDLSTALRVPVVIADGKVRVTVAGRQIEARPTVTAEGSLRLQADGVPALTVPIPRTRLVSCPVASVDVVGDELRASCVVDEIPPGLLRAVSRVSG